MCKIVSDKLNWEERFENIYLGLIEKKKKQLPYMEMLPLFPGLLMICQQHFMIHGVLEEPQYQ